MFNLSLKHYFFNRCCCRQGFYNLPAVVDNAALADVYSTVYVRDVPVISAAVNPAVTYVLVLSPCCCLFLPSLLRASYLLLLVLFSASPCCYCVPAVAELPAIAVVPAVFACCCFRPLYCFQPLAIPANTARPLLTRNGLTVMRRLQKMCRPFLTNFLFGFFSVPAYPQVWSVDELFFPSLIVIHKKIVKGRFEGIILCLSLN